jgi:hypothetical protein
VSRQPDRARDLFGADDPGVSPVMADIHHAPSIADAMAGSYGAVNAGLMPTEVSGFGTFSPFAVDYPNVRLRG